MSRSTETFEYPNPDAEGAAPLVPGVDKVLLAAPRSFCAGVEMAIKALAWMVRILGPPVYCYHEIVHNQLVVERFKGLGVIFVDDIEQVPEGAPLMLSAHGTAPQVVEAARRRNRVVVNAACPLVTKVHQGVKVRASKGYTVIYVGHEGHQEAVGTVAVAPTAVRLVEHAADVAALDDIEGPVAFLTQTTLSIQDWQEVLDSTRRRFPDVWVPEHRDLCFATTNRQAAVRAIAARSDAVVVIGSANSSNARALVTAAEAAGCPRVLRVDRADEVPDDLVGTVGVTGGASTPDDLVNSVVARLAPAEGVEAVTVTEEDEYFPPPRELRELLRAAELTPEAQALLANDRAVPAGEMMSALSPTWARDPELRVLLPSHDARAVEHVLSRYAAQVESEMATVLEELVDEVWMRGAISYHLGWAGPDFLPLPEDGGRSGGKKLRPALAILAYHGARFSREYDQGHAPDPGDNNHLDLQRVLPFAAALELLHNYSLVHDDLQDGDRQRRGRPTLWTLCGPAQAINVGNCLHALSLSSLDRLADRGIDADRVTELIAALARTSVELTIGQQRDIAFESEADVGPERYLQMIGGKTASLTRCATFGGALLAMNGAAPTAQERLHAYADFGRNLGLAFQIRDDVLGIWGVGDKTGKPVGRDIRRKKKSLPIIFALATVKPGVAERCRALYSQPDELTADEEKEVKSVLDDCGAEGYTKGEADRHRRAALAALTTAAGGPAGLQRNRFLADLAGLTNFVANRNF